MLLLLLLLPWAPDFENQWSDIQISACHRDRFRTVSDVSLRWTLDGVQELILILSLNLKDLKMLCNFVWVPMDEEHASDPAERSLIPVGVKSWQYLRMSPSKRHPPKIVFSVSLKSETGVCVWMEIKGLWVIPGSKGFQKMLKTWRQVLGELRKTTVQSLHTCLFGKGCFWQNPTNSNPPIEYCIWGWDLIKLNE